MLLESTPAYALGAGPGQNKRRRGKGTAKTPSISERKEVIEIMEEPIDLSNDAETVEVEANETVEVEADETVEVEVDERGRESGRVNGGDRRGSTSSSVAD